MGWIGQKASLQETFQKYRYVLLAALVGILCMALPEKTEEAPLEQNIELVTESNLEDSLAMLLSNIHGAGQVKILLTQQEGAKTLYQSDEVRTNTDLRTDTVLVTDSSRNETGLIRQIIPPVYRGAVVLCQGAENANIRLQIVEAVKSVTGLTSDHITVLKMK